MRFTNRIYKSLVIVNTLTLFLIVVAGLLLCVHYRAKIKSKFLDFVDRETASSKFLDAIDLGPTDRLHSDSQTMGSRFILVICVASRSRFNS